MALFDLSSSWVTGRCFRQLNAAIPATGRKGLPQIEYGLATDPTVARSRSGRHLRGQRDDLLGKGFHRLRQFRDPRGLRIDRPRLGRDDLQIPYATGGPIALRHHRRQPTSSSVTTCRSPAPQVAPAIPVTSVPDEWLRYESGWPAAIVGRYRGKGGGHD